MMMSVQHAETNNSHARLSSSRASAGASNYNKMKNRFERRSYSLAPSKSMVVKSARRTNHKRNRATSRWSDDKQHPRSYTLADRGRQQRQQSMMVAPPTSYGVSDHHRGLHHEPRFNSRSGTIYSPQNDFHSGNPHLENQHYRERRRPLAASAQRHQITGARRNKNSNAFTRASTMDNSYSFGPPVASQHRRIVVPPLSSTPRSIGSSAKATAPPATQRLPPPISFVNLLQRTLETSVDKIKQTNAGYRAPSSPKSVVGSIISAPSSSDVQAVKKDGRKKEEQETNTTNTGRLAYDPSQPQYSPTYDPDPFYNDNEYSPLFPSWYD